MGTVQEDFDQLAQAFRNLGRAVEQALRDDLRKLRRKMKPIIDEQDPQKIYVEFGEPYDHDSDHYDTSACIWCDNSLIRPMLLWEPDTGCIHSFCIHCGFELNVVEERKLPKLDKLENLDV